MKIYELLTPYNYTASRNKNNKYIVVHYVGSTGSAINNANYFFKNKLKSSAHYFVDEKDVYRVVKDTDISWHCGGGLQGISGHTFYKKCTNSNSIGIEMCCKKDEKGYLYIEDATVKNTIELIKILMEKYTIGFDCVIRHYDVTGKKCPAPYVGDEKWKSFKERLVDEQMTVEEKKQFEEMQDRIAELEQKQEKIYHNWSEIPIWAYESVKKAYYGGFFKGSSSSDLNLPETMMRIIVMNDRVGIYDKE